MLSEAGQLAGEFAGAARVEDDEQGGGYCHRLAVLSGRVAKLFFFTSVALLWTLLCYFLLNFKYDFASINLLFLFIMLRN